MPDEQKQKTVSRREVIKAGGLVALGLTYSKPAVKTVKAKPAFGNYTGVSIGVKVPLTGMSVPVCNPNPNGNVTFRIENVGDGAMGTMVLKYYVYRQATAQSNMVLSVSGDFTGLAPGDYEDVPVDFLSDYKVRLVAEQPPGHPGNSTPQASATSDCQDIDIS